jgi:hypothetical protein
MNQNETAKKGFKTFILTLSISLIVFSVIYYVFTNQETSESDSILSENSYIEDVATEKPAETNTDNQRVDAASSFENLVKSRGANAPQVLAGTTTAPTATGTGTTTPPATTTTTTTPAATTTTTTTPVCNKDRLPKVLRPFHKVVL